LAWAGYLKDWPGPAEGERPTAYIVILGDREISTSFGCDHGIAAQSILLQAVELGYGGCIIGSVDRKTLMDILQIPDQYEVLLVIALGKPIEQVTLTTAKGDIKYWRDSHQVHYVPKRPLQEIIIKRLVEADL
ncbi:MAG: nitroreductase family protein, partial [Limnochordia bacterium]|nr:nitroreductase family protein [Limnochordia bacterium]